MDGLLESKPNAFNFVKGDVIIFDKIKEEMRMPGSYSKIDNLLDYLNKRQEGPNGGVQTVDKFVNLNYSKIEIK